MKISKNKNLKTFVYGEIKKMILFRDLKQGEKVFEKNMSEILEIGRTPVREALLVLEKEGLLENRPGLGLIVRVLNKEEIVDYYNVRQLLEQYAAPLIIENITDDEIQALEQNVAAVETLFQKEDYRELVLQSSRFHNLLAQCAHAPILYKSISSLDDIATLLRAMASKLTDGMLKSMDGHQQILEAIKNKDADALKENFIDHLNESKRRNLSIFELIG